MVSACFSARLSRTQRTVSPMPPSSVCSVSRQNVRMRAGMSPGSRNIVAFGSTNETNGCARCGQCDELVEPELGPLAGPVTPTFVEQPQAGDVAEEPEGSRHATLVRQVRGKRVVADHGAADLDTDERPGADAQEHGSVVHEWHRHDSRTGVVRRDRYHLRAVQPCFVSDVRRERRQRRPRRDDLRKHLRGDVEPPQEIGRPVAGRRVVALGRRRVRELGGLAAAEPEVEQIGDQEQRRRCLERRVFVGGHRRQLEDRVDRKQLDAGALVQLARRDPPEHARGRRGPASIAVMQRGLNELVGGVEQTEVDRPRVDGDRVDHVVASGSRQPVENVAMQALHIPAQQAAAMCDGTVGEPMCLAHREP